MPPSRRAPKLAEQSFMGKLTRHLAVYDALPNLDEDPIDADEELGYKSLAPPTHTSPFAVDSLVLDALPEPKDLAAVAENTRSQLLSLHPSASSSQFSTTPAQPLQSQSQQQQQQQQQPSVKSRSVSFAIGEDSAITTVEEEEEEKAAKPSPPEMAPSKAAAAATAAPGKRVMPVASMMTHPASRVTTGRVGSNPHSMRAPHTFGSLPRASPSGTMPHHAPKALPTVAAAATVQRTRRVARTAAAGNSSPPNPPNLSMGDEGKEEDAAATTPRPASASSRPTSAAAAAAARPSSSDSTKGGRGAPLSENTPRLRPFGAEAKGGALAWRAPAAARPSPRAAPGHTAKATSAAARRDAKSGASISSRHSSSSRGSSRLSGTPAAFAFLVVCCGDEHDGYCCKRHHPDQAVFCCEVHMLEKEGGGGSVSRSRSRSATGSSKSGSLTCPPCGGGVEEAAAADGPDAAVELVEVEGDTGVLDASSCFSCGGGSAVSSVA